MQTQYTIFSAALIFLFLTGCGSAAARANNRGNDLYEESQYTEALDQYRESLSEDPDLTEPYYNSGNTYHQQGNLESAITRLKQANRSAEGELAQKSNYNLGNSFYKAEDWDSAIDAYKQSLRLNPDDQDAKYNLELALKQKQEQEQQQQQQQQQGGGGAQQQPNDQDNQGGGQGEQDQQQPGQNGEQEQQGGGDQPEDNNQGQGQQQEQGPGGGRSLTQQEAEQLLDALGQDNQTLQERLQEGFFAPGRPPEQDW